MESFETDLDTAAGRGKGARRRRPQEAITSVEQLPILLSVSVMAATGAASAPQLRKMLQEGTLEGVKVGSDWRVPKSVFCEYFHLDEQ
jgi:excisionase family DNA binding protein